MSTPCRLRLCGAVLLALLAGGAPATLAQPSLVAPPTDTSAVLTLDSLLARAQTANPSLRAARLEAEALAQRAPQVSALPDPVVMATWQPLPILTARGSQRTQWRVEQQVPYPGKLALQGDVAELSADVATHEADVFAADLALAVERAYYELLRVQEQAALVEAFQGRLEGFEQVAATRYEVGTGSQQAVLKAQVEKNSLAQRLLDLDRQRRSALETLARLVDAPLPEDAVAATMASAPVEADRAALVALARRQRAEARALEAAAERAEAQVALAEKQFLPDFGVSLTYFDLAASDVMPSMTGRDALAVGVSVKVPLQRGRLRAGVEEARLRAAQVAARREALETSFATEIADHLSRLRRETDQLALYDETLVPQAETTLEASLAAYTTGRAGFLDLLDAERMLFSLRMSRAETFARSLQTAAALDRAVGRPLPERRSELR